MRIWLKSRDNPRVPCRNDKKQHGDPSGRGVGGGDAARIAVYEIVVRALNSRILGLPALNGKIKATNVPVTELVISKCYRNCSALLQSHLQSRVSATSANRGRDKNNQPYWGYWASCCTWFQLGPRMVVCHVACHSTNVYGIWSGRADSNCRPHGPEPCALPNCATPRGLPAAAEDGPILATCQA